MGVETIKRRTRAAYGCLVAGQNPVAAGLAYGPWAVRPLCDTRAPLQLQLPLVALYKCCAIYFTFTFKHTHLDYFPSSLSLFRVLLIDALYIYCTP